MNDDEKYLFDLNGYLVLDQVLTPEEVRRCNEAIDHHMEDATSCTPYSRESKSLSGTSTRIDLGGMLNWDRPWCEPFRELLVHPRITPCLNAILGERYRLDHGPGLIAMDPGCGGGTLHGGGFERSNFSEAYFFKSGRIYCGLTVVEVMLADEGPGDGGVAVVPGSHKSNLPCPRELQLCDKYQDQIREINVKTGDVAIFTETLTHGTLAWKGKHQRRAVLYKYSPGFQAYSGGPYKISYPDFVNDMTPEQRAVLEPPSMRR